MDFNSYLFVLAFAPIVVLVYHGLRRINRLTAQWWLILASAVFIAYGDIRYLVFILLSAAVNYGCAFWIHRTQGRRSALTACVSLGIVLNVAVLAYYKYSAFLADNWNRYFHTNVSAENLLVPLGISFLTFQQIMYLVDVSRGEITHLSLPDYLFYILYFPKLVQGPITKYAPLAASLHDSDTVSMDSMAGGLWHFVIGLAKKVLVADVLANAVTWGYAADIASLTSLDTAIVILCYTLQIYFDFSGYSHMAIGISQLLGIWLPDNFDSPYRALSVSEFWKKWHISLTTFLREYIYFPLGGSRRGVFRTYANIMIIFLISGIWHGAAWSYVMWGAVHGVAMCLNRIFAKQWNWLWGGIRWAATFLYINFTWTLFRAPSAGYALSLWRHMFTNGTWVVSDGLMECFRISELTFLQSKWTWFGTVCTAYGGGMVLVMTAAALVLSLLSVDRCDRFRPSVFKCIVTPIVFLWAIISLSSVSQFIYGTF